MDDFDKENICRIARNFAKHINKNLLPAEEEDLKFAAIRQISEAYHIKIIEVVSVFDEEYFKIRYKF